MHFHNENFLHFGKIGYEILHAKFGKKITEPGT